MKLRFFGGCNITMVASTRRSHTLHSDTDSETPTQSITQCTESLTISESLTLSLTESGAVSVLCVTHSVIQPRSHSQWHSGQCSVSAVTFFFTPFWGFSIIPSLGTNCCCNANQWHWKWQCYVPSLTQSLILESHSQTLSDSWVTNSVTDAI